MIMKCRTTMNLSLLLATLFIVVASSPTDAQQPQVAADDQAFAKFVRTRWLLLDEENGLSGAIGTFDAATGKLLPTIGIRIELYGENAELVSRVTTGPGGRFRVVDLKGGLYQCIAQGSNGFLAFSLFAIERGQRTGRSNRAGSIVLVQAPRQTEDRLDLFSAAVPPTFTQLNSILQMYYGRTTPTYVGQTDATATGEASDLRNELPRPDDARPSEEVASAIRAHDVVLQDDNRMVGRLYAMNRGDGSPRNVSEIYVHIIRDDRLVAPPVPVNEDGVFEVELFDGPGAYSIVAAGSGGFGACSFYARRVEDPETAPVASVTLARLRAADRSAAGVIRLLANAAQNAVQNAAPPPYQFTMSVISEPQVMQQAIPAVADPAAIPATGPAVAGGGFADGFPAGDGFAAGGVGAGGGWAGVGWADLLLGGGLAAGITAAALSDDDVQPISPFSPFAN